MALTRRPGAYHCGTEAAMDVIGGRWKVSVLWALEDGDGGPLRFGQLRRILGGITEKVLASHLRELVEDGIVHRQDFAEVPPRVEYSLTPRGKSLYDALETLGDWGQANIIDAASAPSPT
ncbi:winged helix-turn-helix transcriptional regulator [Nocardiopsis aegyptia]|uniref:DNA-binding HxlR family transcriptional regulator n=1 Tax=Nocardiopsis aegyptia TaxID=220378 RepID=A0A7Z0EQK4_9ACTN|nr:helix-turn-helix domain-containing protein [Nocardiopsis aegyptia]NYJ36442.1 DNA-binding HxlR family transcriptional regulator [Nocardiopsis aegyptia]